MPGYKIRLWDGEQQFFGASPAPQKIHGSSKVEDITLERGVVEDSGFADWAAGVAAGNGKQKGGGSSALQKIQGYSKLENITLKRGVVNDSGFADWLAGSSKPHKVHMEIYNDSGQSLVSYKISGNWVTEYPPLILHGLHKRRGKTTQEKLAGIIQESLSRVKRG